MKFDQTGFQADKWKRFTVVLKITELAAPENQSRSSSGSSRLLEVAGWFASNVSHFCVKILGN